MTSAATPTPFADPCDTCCAGARDFDFLLGPWAIRNTRLVRRLAGCTEWETFDATGHARLLPGGIGNYDDFVPAAWKPGYVGMSLRVFSPVSRQWSIYWLDNATGGVDAATGLLHPPVVGGFVDGKGLFNGQDVLAHPGAVRMVTHAYRHAALAAVVLGRRRPHLGDELGDGVFAAAVIGCWGVSAWVPTPAGRWPAHRGPADPASLPAGGHRPGPAARRRPGPPAR